MLLIQLFNAGAPAKEVRVNASTITVGRDANSTVVLEDSTKHISRLHATIELVDDAYFITVHSRVNPVLVDGRVLRTGQTMHLNDGARVTMSPYELEIRMIDEPASGSSRSSLGGLDALDMDARGADAPAGSGRAAPNDDAFSVLDALGPAPPPPAAVVADPFQMPPQPLPAGSGLSGVADLLGDPGAGGHAHGISSSGDLPLDPMALLDRAAGAVPAPTGGGSAFDLLQGVVVPVPRGAAGRNAVPHGQSYDGLGGGRSGLDHVHDINLPYSPPPILEARTPGPSTLAAPVHPAGSAVSMAATGSAHPLDPFHDGFDPFADLMAPPAVGAAEESAFDEKTPDPGRQGPAEAGSALGVAAFLRGAGLEHVNVPAADEVMFLEQAGVVMHAVVETLMVLLIARTEVKRELRAEDRTMLSSRDNNPLKMMSDPAEALAFLFDPSRQQQGFLPPVQAVQDAAKDLRAHELALVAGLRAAVLGTIKRFDPAIFEKAAAKAAGPLAINMRAKSWDAFTEAHAKLDRDAADRIDDIFQRDFLRAYTEQVKLLTR